VADFKKRVETDTLVASYKDRVLVYLESEEDLHIFARCWFFEQMETLEFRAASVSESGGCTNVIASVQKDRKDGVISYGLVDRDTLMRSEKWDVFWERDNKKFATKRPFGDYITVLCRWEIENYLLDLEELELIFANNPLKGLREIRSEDEVVKEFLHHCEVLIPVMAANVLYHINGRKALSIDFAYDVEDRTKMEQKVQEHILKTDLAEDSLHQHREYMKRFESFAENYLPSSKERLDRLNRMIDGKGIWHRLEKQHKIRGDRRFEVAIRIKEKSKIDKEITDYIERIKS
jgi:hypothetical protein